MRGGVSTRAGSPVPTPVRRRYRPRRGVGLVELLIALSISALLLTATAYAVKASLLAYEINQEQSLLMQRSRVALNYITTSVRTAKLHAPDTAARSTQFAAGATVTDTAIDMYDLSGTLLTFRYDATNKRILAISGTTTNVLAQGVDDFSVRMEPMRSANSIRTGGGWDLLKRATVTMTVRTNAALAGPTETTGSQTVTMSASAMPRRNAW